MLTELLFPPGTSLQVLTVTLSTDKMRVDIAATAATAATAPCSNCHSHATRIHSRYHRTLADLPVAKLQVYVRVQVRRFYCDNPACHKRTFSEPVPDLTLPFARRTTRLADEQRQLGLDVGGEVGARTAKRQGMPVSADTILRLVRRTQPAEPEQLMPTPTKLGIDDFALRKGHRYGTILVDLEKHRPIDLLPDRSAQTLEAWLREHPGVQLIARDRASEYAEAAAHAAPDAVQVADRFHLMQNVREMLQRLLERHQAALRAASKLQTTSSDQQHQQLQISSPAPVLERGTTDTCAVVAQVGSVGSDGTEPTEPTWSCADRRKQARRAERLELYQTVQGLHSAGYSQRDIARQLHLGRPSVRRFRPCGGGGVSRAWHQTSSTEHTRPFCALRHKRISAGQGNGLQLWREIRDQQGYHGSRALVARWVARHRHLCPAPDPVQEKQCQQRRGAPAKQTKPIPSAPRQERRRCSARQAAFLLVRREEELEPDDLALLERLCGQDPEVQTARKLSGEFLMMIRERKGERLDDWLGRAEASGIAEESAIS